MNDLSKLPLKHSYDSGVDDILWNFYIPVLSQANHYDRIAGFYNSASLAITAKGMAEFISNGGDMRLVTCPELSAEDIEMLERVEDSLENIMLRNFITDYASIEHEFERNHVKAMGWMLANGRLSIKIAVIKKNGHILNSREIQQSGIMHQKVGILYDQCGNTVSFSGSNNESLSGWLFNTEEFKAFFSWDGGYPYYKDDEERFKTFWEGRRKDVIIMDVPEALEKALVKESIGFEPSMLDVRKYYPEQYTHVREKSLLRLFYYQEKAVQMWQRNSRSLMLEMATGCGKTRTAIGCMAKAISDTERLLVVISTPQVTLSSQWHNDINGLDIEAKHSLDINGGIRAWRITLQKELRKLKVGQYRYFIIYTTHDISSSPDFINLVELTGRKVVKFLIADEVHGLGAPRLRRALLDCYTYRLGLSATPQRWFDDEGSAIITEYFGNQSFVFSIADALTEYNPITHKHFLVQYRYHPHFVNLTDDELEEYEALTLKIARSSGKEDDDNQFIQLMRFKRADIEKNAFEKYDELERILDELGPDISDTIIFVSAEQIDKVILQLGNRGIIATRFTQEQGTVPMEQYGGLSEREYIIQLFKQREYHVLVAIKCLDEGIDIPSADTAIVMASSTNPREYIQRIGRVIRQAENKGIANIYDMILKPDLKAFREERLIKLERRIFDKEMDRVLDLSRNALNNVTVLNEAYRIKREVIG